MYFTFTTPQFGPATIQGFSTSGCCIGQRSSTDLADVSVGRVLVRWGRVLVRWERSFSERVLGLVGCRKKCRPWRRHVPYRGGKGIGWGSVGPRGGWPWPLRCTRCCRRPCCASMPSPCCTRSDSSRTVSGAAGAGRGGGSELRGRGPESGRVSGPFGPGQTGGRGLASWGPSLSGEGEPLLSHQWSEDCSVG